MQGGERVLAYNPQTHKREYEPIRHVWINHDNDLVDLTITTTKGQQGKAESKTSEVIHTNQKHPFLTLEDGFVPVRDLKLGMHLVRADGRVGVITGWKVVPGSSVMYNLEVAQDHTFAVGDGQWVVHNCGGDPPGGWQKADYGPDNKTNISDFTHVDDDGNTLEVTFYHDTGELQIGWMDSATQAKNHLPELVHWLGDDVQTISGYATGDFATHFSSGSNGLAAVNRMLGPALEGSGFGPGILEPEGNRLWIVFRRSQ